MKRDAAWTAPACRAAVRCRDLRLIRLLEVELSLCGVTVVSENEDYDLLLWDLDDFPQLPPVEEDAAILCWSREDAPKADLDREKYRFLHRPFALRDFENIVRSMLMGVSDGFADGGACPSLSPKTHFAEVNGGKTSEKEKEERSLDLTDGVVSVRGEAVPLTPREYALFSCLWERRGEAVPKAVLWEALCAVVEDGTPATNTLEVYICHLRRKLERPTAPRVITTVRGVGYRLNV